MKKVISTLCIVCFYHLLSYSQTHFGVKAGLNFAGIANDQNTSLATKSITRFHVGILANLALNDNVSLQPQLLLSQKGFGLNIPASKTTKPPTLEQNLRFNLNYLEMPVNIVYHIDGIEGVYVGAGPYFAYALSGSASDGITKQDIDFGTGSNRFDYGWNASLAIDIVVGYRLQINYSKGRGEVFNSALTGASQNRYFGFSILKIWENKH